MNPKISIYIYVMIKTIIKNLDLESDIKLISPIDEIKLSLKKDTYNT